jgi:hypothetical protein
VHAGGRDPAQAKKGNARLQKPTGWLFQFVLPVRFFPAYSFPPLGNLHFKTGSGHPLFIFAPFCHCHARVSMWHIPPRSPDLNPIEKYWAWLRKALLARDLSDAVAKRPALDKAGYANRVRAICRTPRAQAVAAACSKSLRKTCAEVIRLKGAATRG